MNGTSHANIMRGAYAALPEEIRRIINQPEKLIGDAGNYPDFFDDPTVSEEEKYRIDPEWKKYTVYPGYLPARHLHFISAPVSCQFERIPVYTYLFEQMITSCREENYSDFIKFSGCLSHAMGDATQPAHIGPDSNNLFISQMLPVPDKPYLKDFHYHTSVEAVNGECTDLAVPVMLGISAAEAGWRLACDCQQAVIYCRRFIVPTIQALFENDQGKAEALAVEPVTLAAQMTANAIYTAFMIAEGKNEELSDVDLRLLPPMEQFHDLVYGSAILDGNKKVPPNSAPITPGKLNINGNTVTLSGLGMLPHSGMNGERSCYMTWLLPEKVFRLFTGKAGLHIELGNGGAVEFQVLLDGKIAWSSGRMTVDSQAMEISLAINTARSLTLKVLAAGSESSFWKNHAYWGEPELKR